MDLIRWIKELNSGMPHKKPQEINHCATDGVVAEQRRWTKLEGDRGEDELDVAPMAQTGSGWTRGRRLGANQDEREGVGGAPVHGEAGDVLRLAGGG
jgi:hypothetical protein